MSTIMISENGNTKFSMRLQEDYNGSNRQAFCTHGAGYEMEIKKAELEQLAMWVTSALSFLNRGRSLTDMPANISIS